MFVFVCMCVCVCVCVMIYKIFQHMFSVNRFMHNYNSAQEFIFSFVQLPPCSNIKILKLNPFFFNSSLHYMFRPTRPSSGASKFCAFRATAVGVYLFTVFLIEINAVSPPVPHVL
jgi:hypothetical protein